MTIEAFRNVLLDTINRPVNEVWIERTENFIVQSFNRLSQKLLFEPLQIQLAVEMLASDMLTSDNKAVKLDFAKPYTQSIYSEKLGKFLKIELVNTYPAQKDWETDTVYRNGTTYYFHKYLLESKIYFFFTCQLHVSDATEIDQYSTIAKDFFDNAFDFIYYDVLIKLSNLIGNDLNKTSFYKQLRDEAYVDFASWANSINDRGTLQIEG